MSDFAELTADEQEIVLDEIAHRLVSKLRRIADESDAEFVSESTRSARRVNRDREDGRNAQVHRVWS